MKKTICSKKLEKIFIICLIFMLVGNFIFPNIVWALAPFAQPAVTGSIKDVVDSMTTPGNASTTTINDKIFGAEEKVKELKKEVMNAIDSKFPDLADGMSEKAYNYYQNDKSSIKVSCNIAGGGTQTGYSITGFTVVLGETLTQSKIETDIGDKTNEEIGEVDTNGGSLPPSSAATGQISRGQNSSKGIISSTTGLDTFTGYMLEPTVKFFTFVLDAIMSVFSSVMKEKEFEFVVVNQSKIEKIQNLGNVVGTITIEDMKPYESATGSLKHLKYPNFYYSPEELFAGEIDLVDVNFIGSSNDHTNWKEIRKVISQWYQILRMIAIIGLLSVLIYTGIKIILSSTAKDKAKYKEMIVNWFVAVILAFSMHYIMAFILSVVDAIVGLFAEITGVIQVTAGDKTFQTNLIGLARFQMQIQLFSSKIGYLIIYAALITYTIKFTFLYFKRMLKMAFLTIISPIVALTYPIDKMDGEAKGFNMWLREFIFNALLQPLHYILYYILVSSSVTLAARNPIYGVAAMMFMSQAEKLLKRIFGFNKARAGTVGGIAGAFATGAVTSSLIKYMKNPSNLFGGGNSGNSRSSSNTGNSNYVDNYAELPNDIQVNEDTDFENFIGRDIRSAANSKNPTAIKNIIPNIDELLLRHDGKMPGIFAELQSGSVPGVNSSNIGDILNMITEYQIYKEGGDQSGSNPSKLLPENSPWRRKSKQSQRVEQPKAIRGIKHVGKTMLKPVWDTEKDFIHNAKALGDKVGAGVAGAAVGITAAAVQAGISLTDGKYSLGEGIATIGAGIAGVSGIAEGTKKSSKEFKADEKNIEKYANEWYNNDSVINYFNKEFYGRGKEMRKRASKNYVTRGITDVHQQKQALKFAEQLKSERGMDEDEADKLAVATLQYKQSLNNNFSMLYDKKKRKNYLNARADAYTGAASRATIIKLHDDFLENVSDFNRANQ